MVQEVWDKSYTIRPLLSWWVCRLVFSFQNGLFNIGVIGQFTIAAYVAIIIGAKLTMPASVHWLVAMLGRRLGWCSLGGLPGSPESVFQCERDHYNDHDELHLDLLGQPTGPCNAL